MTLPGFAAEAAIYRSDQQYRGARVAAISSASGVTVSQLLPENTPCANYCNIAFGSPDPCTCALSLCGSGNNSLNCCYDFFNYCPQAVSGSMGGGGSGTPPGGRPQPRPI
jgi:hypothetical protein